MRSIRGFLLSRLLAGSALVLVLAGVVVYLAVARSLQAEFDRSLVERVRALASTLFQVGDQVEFEFSDQLMPEYGGEEAETADTFPSYFELRFDDGRLLERSNSLRGGSLALEGTAAATPSHWNATLPDGRAGRYVAQRVEVHHVYPEEGPERPVAAGVVVVIAKGREELAAFERRVLLQCTAVCLVLVGLIATLSWKAVDRGLAPARRLAKTLDSIQVERPPERLDVGELPAELQPFALTVDALMGRVDTALQRERRTTADIAHELRTPISEMLTVSEVALREGREVDGPRRALEKVREVAWRMNRSLSTLLKLARLEMGAESVARAGVDLEPIVQEILRTHAAVGRERGIRIQNEVEPGDRVEGDVEVLRIVVSNLLSNALYHSPGGTVRCRLERDPSGWRFLVENDAGDLDPADLRYLSEPFWRKDRARADSGRSGLGLALSRALAERTGLVLGFELDAGRFRAVLASPSALAGGDGPAGNRVPGMGSTGASAGGPGNGSVPPGSGAGSGRS